MVQVQDDDDVDGERERDDKESIVHNHVSSSQQWCVHCSQRNAQFYPSRLLKIDRNFYLIIH